MEFVIRVCQSLLRAFAEEGGSPDACQSYSLCLRTTVSTVSIASYDIARKDTDILAAKNK
jgi:hypothetical protein